MRVLSVDPAGELWGSERALLDLVEGTRFLEWVVCCPPRTPLLDQLRQRGVSCFPYYVSGLDRRSRYARLWASFGVIRACLRSRPTVIHVNQAGALRTCLPAARLFGLPVVCHVRLFEDVAYLARRLAGGRAGVSLIAVSRSLYSELAAQPALVRVPCRWAYDAFVRAGEPRKQSPGPGRVLCLGRICESKGQRLLVEAVRSTRIHEFADVEIIGSGAEAYVKELQADAAGVVTWRGFDCDAAKRILPGDIVVVPSLREPLGRVILEAWSAGALPVVCRQSGGAAEIIEQSGGGLLYDAPDTVALGSALQDALRMTVSQRMAVARAGYDWAQEHCNPAVSGREFFEVLLRAVGSP